MSVFCDDLPCFGGEIYLFLFFYFRSVSIYLQLTHRKARLVSTIRFSAVSLASHRYEIAVLGQLGLNSDGNCKTRINLKFVQREFANIYIEKNEIQ